MQYPDELSLPAAGNKAYDKDEIKGTPDFTLDMWSFHNTNSRRLVIGECAFTQRDADVTEKLRAYLRQPSDTLVAFKILITEDPPYSTPSLTPSAAKQSLSLERDEFDRANEGDFARVTVGRHTWLSISSVEFHVWIRQPGESSIDVDRLESGGHTVGVRSASLTPHNTDDHPIDVLSYHGRRQSEWSLRARVSSHQARRSS